MSMVVTTNAIRSRMNGCAKPLPPVPRLLLRVACHWRPLFATVQWDCLAKSYTNGVRTVARHRRERIVEFCARNVPRYELSHRCFSSANRLAAGTYMERGIQLRDWEEVCGLKKNRIYYVNHELIASQSSARLLRELTHLRAQQFGTPLDVSGTFWMPSEAGHGPYWSASHGSPRTGHGYCLLFLLRSIPSGGSSCFYLHPVLFTPFSSPRSLHPILHPSSIPPCTPPSLQVAHLNAKIIAPYRAEQYCSSLSKKLVQPGPGSVYAPPLPKC